MQDVQKLYDARVSGENLTPGQDILVNTIEDAYDIQEELETFNQEIKSNISKSGYTFWYAALIILREGL